jgi:hypothetical protein
MFFKNPVAQHLAPRMYFSVSFVYKNVETPLFFELRLFL